MLNIENYKIIIIENNGSRRTFLDSLNCIVFYTNNNKLLGNVDKGYKELKDIHDCIDFYNIKDDDFIVKMTGRYILENNSEFMNIIKNIHITKYYCVIKYGPYFKPVDYKTNNCITGLIGMSCFYVKQIQYITKNECIETKWADITYSIDDNKICLVKTLGIHICPGSNTYFIV